MGVGVVRGGVGEGGGMGGMVFENSILLITVQTLRYSVFKDQ